MAGRINMARDKVVEMEERQKGIIYYENPQSKQIKQWKRLSKTIIQ